MVRAIPFESPLAAPSQVGGKALSLMRLTHAGQPVPPGFTLPVAFFDAWLDEMSSAVGFAGLADDPLASGAALKEAAGALTPSASQLAIVEEALASLPADALFAVRSSSPEEDLESASFAGAYESVLGVSRAGLWNAIRRAFASCFDARVAIYKQRRGLDPRRPRIAVVVQQQIRADAAGVAFSVDPVTHDAGIAVLNANWGLGESVVSGIATPDEIRVERASRRLLAHLVGAKETAIRIAAEGGTEPYEDPRADQPCLDEAQILTIVAELDAIERLYERAVDVEWAWAHGRLHVLQARPVTTGQ